MYEEGATKAVPVKFACDDIIGLYGLGTALDEAKDGIIPVYENNRIDKMINRVTFPHKKEKRL